MPDSKSEDSLRGYDMVVSVSEDAINKQFQYLWETPIPSRLMPRPSSLTGYDKLSPAKYYINHDLKIYPMLERPYESLPVERRPKDRPTNGVVPVRSPYGIEGHILAPTVSFRGEKRGDNVDFRCVRITFKFVRDETAPEGLQDSIIRYHDAFLGDQKKSINGCTVTWLADISSANIEDYMGDLVKASTDTNLPTLLPQGVIAKLESVDPRKFLASSLFCLFEKNEILNSFDLVNPNAPLAHPDGSPAEDPILPAMAAQIAMYFNKLSKLPPGRPTPDNPFVLGYGIIAKVPPVSAADNNRAANTPYFVPKLFHLTVTPGANGFTKGTLNYCIMTHRAQGIPEDTVDIKDDSGLGIFKQTLFETSRSNGTSGGADGVMAFSKKIFSDFWLQSEIATNFKIDPYALSPYLLPKNDPVAQAPAVAAFKSDTETKSRGCTIRTEFTYDPMQCKPMAIDEALNNMVPEDIRNEIKKTLPNFYLYLQQRAAKGHGTVSLEYDSDLIKQPTTDWRDTAANRKIYLNLTIETNFEVKLQTSGMSNIHAIFKEGIWNGIWDTLGLLGDDNKVAKIISEWRNARQANVKIKARIGFDLTPAGSSWVLKQSDSSDRTTLPASGSKFDPEVLGPVEYTFEENLASAQKELPAPTRVTGDGMKIELINHEMWKQFGETMEMEKFKDVAAAWGGEAVKKTQDTVDALTKGLQNTLILPAGNVFEFKQLNADPRGHVYTLVTYKTPTDLVQTANN